MRTVVLEVASLEAALVNAARDHGVGPRLREARISLRRPSCSGMVLTAGRRELLKALCGAGVISIREAARRVGRDVKAVHGDITVL